MEKYISNLPTEGKYQCEICGRYLKRKNKAYGKTLCSKHLHQMMNYGKTLDSIPRTQKDLNGYIVKEDCVIGEIYDGKNSQKIGEFIVDREDFSKIRYHKWRLSHSHIVTGLPAKGTQRDLSWMILNLDNRKEENFNKVVDHINGNAFDNRKQNLRICTQSQNVLNKSFMSNNTSGFIGVSYKKDRNTYNPEIRISGKRCHLGAEKSLEDAVYKRYVAEELLFKEFNNKQEHNKKYEFTKNIPEKHKQELFQKVCEKLKEKNLWQ